MTSAKASEILDAAEKRMRMGGYAAVSYRDLANEVGIKGASVHYHFPKKELLGEAVVDRYADRFLSALGSAERSDEGAQERVQRLTAAYKHALATSGLICLCCVLGAQSKELPQKVSLAVERFFDRVLDWAEHAFDEYEDAALRASYAISLLQGAMVLSVAQKRPEILDDAASMLELSLS